MNYRAEWANGPRGIRGNSPIHRYERQEQRGWFMPGHINGFILSNDGTDATNDIGISAGTCRSTANIGPDGQRTTLPKHQADLELPVAIIKQLDVAWAPENYDPENGIGGGARSGLRSSSSISDTTWHIFAIGGFDCPTDILAHDGVDPSAELPNGYTAWRRIGSIVRASSAIRAFTQMGDEFLWLVQIRDVSENVASTSAQLKTLSLPTGIKVLADVNFYQDNTSASTTLYVSSPDQTDSAPSASFATLTAAEGATVAHELRAHIRTNTSAQIRTRHSATGAVFRIWTNGWRDLRGKDA